MPIQNKRVAIVGAGPAGAIALEAFLSQGFRDVVVIERRPVVGGTWSLDELIGSRSETGLPIEPSLATSLPENVEQATRAQPVVKDAFDEAHPKHEGSLYPQVETNVTADLMAFTGKPFADVKPAHTYERFGVEDAFRSHDVVRQYVTEYFDGREQYVLLNTAVEKAYKQHPQGKWSLVLHRDNQWWTEEFDYLYASTGRFDKPRIPDIDGLKGATAKVPKRTIIHSKAFRGPEEFVGKHTVLLVGASFSNSDVAHIVKDSVQLPIHLSLRGIEEYHVQSFSQPWIVSHPSIAKIAVNPDGKRLDVTFSDGSVLREVDKLVFGTGYVFSYPFLDEYTRSVGHPFVSEDGSQTQNLYWFTWWAPDPTLAVSSAISEGITWRVMEAQAKSSSYLWAADDSALPTLAEAVKWETERRARTGATHFQRWHPHYKELFEGLARTSSGDTHFPGEPRIDYGGYTAAVENSLNLKGKWFSRVAANSIAEHPEWQEQYNNTIAFLKAHERPFSEPTITKL